MSAKALSYIAILFLLFGCLSLKAGDRPVVKNVIFLPITIAIACNADTLVAYQTQYLRAEGARPEVGREECADNRKVIDNILPKAADVEYSSTFHMWLVGITLNEKDALSIRELSTKNVGAFMLIGVKKKILSISQLASPLRGNKIYINAYSEESAHNIATLLGAVVDKSS